MIKWFLNLLEKRQSIENPTVPLSYPVPWLLGNKTLSGVSVTEKTALQITAIFACVRIIAESIGSLPLHVYERQGERNRRKNLDAREYDLLHDQPNDRMSACVFREVVTAQTLLYGNGYALIEFDGGGKTKAFWPLLHEKVKPRIATDGRRLEYEVTTPTTNNREETKIYPADEILHIPALSFDGVTGLSPIILHREGIGLTKALEEFGAEYFGGGTHLSGVLQSEKSVSKPAQDRLKESWTNLYTGRGKRHQVAVLEEGLKFQTISIQPDTAQFIESRKFQLNEVARIFRVPPHMIGDLERATFSNIEFQGIEFVEYTLRPWLVRWEQEINRKLFKDRRQYAEHNIDGLQRGDFGARMQGFATGRQWGWYCVDDIRELLNMNALPGDEGKQFLVPTNMTTPELLENPPKPVLPAPKPQAEETEEPRSKQEVKQFIRPTFADAIRRCLNYESKDPAKLERFVSRAFAPVMCSLAAMTSADMDMAMAYADSIHSRVAKWAATPLESILDREIEMAFNFVGAKEVKA